MKKARGRGRPFGNQSGQSSDRVPAQAWGSKPRNVAVATNSSTLSAAGDSNENPKFKEACERIRKNIVNHIAVGANDSSSSEDELEGSLIIQKTFQKYNAGEGDVEPHKTRELLQESLTSGAVVCLICIESVKRNDPVWSCQLCFCMLHISCIQKWAKDSMFHQASNEAPDKPKASERKWCCPKCRYEYKASDVPSTYRCFCGKVENPPLDPWIVPHSCGQTCEKDLQPPCGHQCLLLCHPGSCPPCPIAIQASCHCGRSRPIAKRCCIKEWSCGKRCNKLLACNQHYCDTPCHGGECEPCNLMSRQSCICGAETELRPCFDRHWTCQRSCSKPLECGNHLCEVVCHDGHCPPCPRSGPRPCPCNKKLFRLPCTEDVLPCGDTCNKVLECGLHNCIQRCHLGQCGNCLQMRVMSCRCGQRTKSVPCCKEFLCDIKCKNKRDCGKHNCNRKCCVGNCPPCEVPCGKTLNCGSHKCESRCHLGPCFPCKESAEIKCNCGNTKITIPCGRRRSAVPPQCNSDCKLPSNCHHEQRQQHRCHFGDCPPCRLVCNKTHPCSHSCPAKCHDAVLTKVEVKKKCEGPWDIANAFKMQLVKKPCPPCVVPVPMTCLGNHVVHDFHCHEAKLWSCGRPCGRHLECGNHLCELECHETGNASTEQSERCESCLRPCGKSRPKGCTHICRKPCHPNDCDLCKEMLKMRCHCQINALYISCSEWTNADEYEKERLLCCLNTCPQQLSCGHRCPKVCHKDACPDRTFCRKKATVRCPCKRIKKDFPCIAMVETIKCDEECLANKEMLKAQEQAQKDMERRHAELKQEQELEEFRRKTEGRRKKNKKAKVLVEKKSLWKQYWPHMLLVVIASIILSIFFVPLEFMRNSTY